MGQAQKLKGRYIFRKSSHKDLVFLVTWSGKVHALM